MDFSNKKAFVVDNGLFGELAVRLSKEFGEVFYYSPWEECYVKSNNRLPGYGVPGIQRMDEIFRLKDKIDLWVFPDLYHADLQLELEAQGCRVWGSRDGEEIELYRDESKQLFKKLELPVIPYEVIVGLDKLRSYLKKNDEKFVKVSVTRGDFESFYAKNYKYIEARLDELEHCLGAKKHIAEFIVEDSIEAVEIGYDGFCIDGQFPDKAIVGIEVKDKGYIGHVHEFSKIPAEITEFLNAISGTMKQYKYRNFLSTENRVTENHVSYMNDPCCRAGSPPTESVINNIDNLAEIMWEGAAGNLVSPKYSKPWIAEVIIDSFWSDRNWQPIQFPDKIRDNVKLRQFCMIENQYYVIPQAEGSTAVGAVVAAGDTMEEAIKNLKNVCEQIEGYYLNIHKESLDYATEEISKLKKMRIEL